MNDLMSSRHELQQQWLMEGEATEPRASLQAWAALFVLLLFTIISYVDRTIISLMVDPIKRDLDVTDVEISLLQGFAFASVYALATLPMGVVADRFSRRSIIAIGVSLWSLATISGGFARSYAQLFVARCGVGIGEAALPPAAYAIVGETFPTRRRATAIGLLGAGSALGASLAYMLGGIAIAWGEKLAPQFGMSDWQFVFVLVGLPGLVCLPLLLIVPKPARKTATVSIAEDSRAYYQWLRRNGLYVVTLALGVGCLAATMYAASAWAPSYFIRHFGLGAANVGVSLGSIHVVTGLVGFVGAGWLVDRLHASGLRQAHFKVMVGAIALSSLLGIMCFGFAPTATMAFSIIGILYMTAAIVGPAIGHLHLATPAAFHGRTIALYQLLMNLFAMIVGPSTAALFAQELFGGPEHIGSGLAATFTLLGPLGLVFIAIAWRGGRRALAEAQSMENKHRRE